MSGKTTKIIDEDREVDLQNAECRLKHALNFIECLYYEEQMSQTTYKSLDDNILWVLHLIQKELYPD